MIPIRFVQALTCTPGPTCPPLIAIQDLRESIDRANEVFADAGIKFWIKSDEYYNLSIFNAFDSTTMYTWSQLKAAGIQSVFPAAPSNAYYDNADAKTVDDWMVSLSAFY